MAIELDKKGLEAAAIQMAALRGLSVTDEADQRMFGEVAAKVIRAYLSASSVTKSAETEHVAGDAFDAGEIVERLKTSEKRLRQEIEYDHDEPDGPGEITAGRVFADSASAIAEAISDISHLQQEVERLTKERDAAMDSAHNWHGQCQAIATILEMHEPECLGFAGEVRAKYEAAEAQLKKVCSALNYMLDPDVPYSVAARRFGQQRRALKERIHGE